MRRKVLSIIGAGVASAALLGAALIGSRHQAARADATNYSSQLRQVRACVLVTDASQDKDNVAPSGYYASNITPYVFYALDSRTDLKPAGVTFMNPMAPTIITQDIYNRWKNRNLNNNDHAFQNGTAESAIFRIGAPVGKNLGAYWEVNLDKVSQTDLQQFDVVLVSLHSGRLGGAVAFTPQERESLRRFVDAGGTVWLENEGVGSNAISAESFFVGLNTTNAAGTNNPSITSAHHPLVNYPYTISQQDVRGMGVLGPFGRFSDQVPGAGGLALSQATVPVIQQGGFGSVFAGDYGAGHVLVTSARIAGDLNNFLLNNANNTNGNPGSQNVVGGANDGAVSGDNIYSIPPNDLKFGYNLTTWISSVPTPNINARRTGASQENLGASLLPKWSPVPVQNPANVGSGAVLYKGAAYWVDGNNTLHCYNANPQNQSDIGIPDLVYGAPFDQIWNDGGKSLGNAGSVRASTPTVLAVNTANGPLDVCVVATTDGATHVYNAFPTNPPANILTSNAPRFTIGAATGNMQPALSVNGTGINAGAGAPYGPAFAKPVPAPVYSDGILFTLVFNKPTDMNNELGWRVAPIDLAASLASNGALTVFGGDPTGATTAPSIANNAPGFYAPEGNLTVGYVKDPNSEAIDRVVYVPSAASDNNKTPGVVHAVWFSTHNETLTADTHIDPNGKTFIPNGLRGRAPWYANTGGQPGSINLNPVVHVVHHNAAGAVTGMNTFLFNAGFSVSFTTDTVANASQLAASQKLMRVVFNNYVPASTDTVTADYTLDWPALSVGGTAVTQPDLDQFTITRDFRLFTQDYTKMTPEFTGGVTLSSLDNLLFTETNLRDTQSGAPLEDRIYCARDQYGAQATTATGIGPRVPSDFTNWMFAPVPQTELGMQFNNYVLPQRLVTQGGVPLYGFKAIGAPVTYNGAVYVVGTAYTGQGGGGAPQYIVMLALNENVDTTINIGALPNANATITLAQPSLLSPSNSGNAGIITLRQDTDFTLDRVLDANTQQYQGIVHILNFRPGNGDACNIAVPFFVQVPGSATTGYVPVGVNKNTGFSNLDNLQYYVAIPITQTTTDKNGYVIPQGIIPTSGASISGGSLYFMANIPSTLAGPNNGKATSQIVSIDLQRAPQSIKGAPVDQKGLSLVSTAPITDVTTGNPLIVTEPSIHPPVGTANTAVAANAQSLVGLDNGLILIADGKRLLEVDAGGNASWSLETTRSLNLVGGAQPGTGGVANTAIPLARPTLARRFTLNDYLVVDSGNNRVLGSDRGGNPRFELHGFADPMQFLRPGDPLTFNEPTDADTYSIPLNNLTIYNRDTKATYTYNSPCTVYHYIVADSGNYRIVDIIDVYDATTGQIAVMTGPNGPFAASQVLSFTSRSLGEQNERYRYRTVQQFTYNNADYIIASVSNVRQGVAAAPAASAFGNNGSSLEGPGGSLIAIQRGSGQNGNPNQAGDVYSVINSIVIQDTTGKTVRRQAISNPTWFKEFSTFDVTNPGNGQVPRFLLADANGCYVLKAVGQDYVVDWMLSADDYFYLTGRKLQATSITRELVSDLSSRNQFEPRYLITNAYSGPDNILDAFGVGVPGVVSGEVFEIKGKDYYDLPTTNGVYNGYRNAGINRRLYTINNGNFVSNIPALNPVNGTSSITRMIPNETLAGTNVAIKRTIGSTNGSLSTYTLQQPQYAERPF